MARSKLKLWRAPLATLQASLDEGEIGIADETGQFVRRPDGQPAAALVAVGGSQPGPGMTTNVDGSFSPAVRTVNGQVGDVAITSVTGNAGTATKLLFARTFNVAGDAAGTASFDGSGDTTLSLSLVNSGVAAGTYGDTTKIPVLTVDAKGRVVSISTVTASGGSGGSGSSSTFEFQVNFTNSDPTSVTNLPSGWTAEISGQVVSITHTAGKMPLGVTYYGYNTGSGTPTWRMRLPTAGNELSIADATRLTKFSFAMSTSVVAADNGGKAVVRVAF